MTRTVLLLKDRMVVVVGCRRATAIGAGRLSQRFAGRASVEAREGDLFSCFWGFLTKAGRRGPELMQRRSSLEKGFAARCSKDVCRRRIKVDV